MNYSLFSTDPGQSGYRLHAYELWNWGTFNGPVYKIEPMGESTLLTGANASGKTTLVDGLLTLLVPEKRMRYYNQTAGSKGERTEESYVLGEYGEKENELTSTKEIKRLRPDRQQAQCILLAVFQSEQSYVTLAQVRWFSGGELQRAFLLVHKALSIGEDFFPLDNSGDWKRRLRHKYPKAGMREVLFMGDSGSEYGRQMRKVFGMRSEKAHTLFSQTIGLKILGDLNEFVRRQMLEDRDPEFEFQKIKNHFKSLNDAHQAIAKACAQLDLLRPIGEKAFVLTSSRLELVHLQEILTALPYWFARKEASLLSRHLESCLDDYQSLTLGKEACEEEVAGLSYQDSELVLAIKNDEVGRQISQLEKERQDLLYHKKEKQGEASRYNELAKKVSLGESMPSGEHFLHQRTAAQAKKKEADGALEQTQQAWRVLYADRQHLTQKLEHLTTELTLLGTQENNITGAAASIRRKLLEHLSLSEQDLPFAGELIRVRKDARDWEPVLEKVLHEFALHILVPQACYAQVNWYVHENDLGGRVRYQRFTKIESAPTIFQEVQKKGLLEKLDFKSSAYVPWVKSELTRLYDYLCADELDEFSLATKAILKSGLIKNHVQHEKDDSPELQTRKHYVLGWETKEKIAVLKAESSTILTDLTHFDTQIDLLQARQAALKGALENLTRFVEFSAFTRIDWWSAAVRLQEIGKQLDALQQTSDRMKTLKRQHDAVLAQLSMTRERLDMLKISLRDLESDIRQHKKRLVDLQEIIDSFGALDAQDPVQRLAEYFGAVEMTLDSAFQVQSRLTKSIGDQVDALKDKLRKESSAAETYMRAFVNPKKELLQKFTDWDAEAHLLQVDVEFIEEFVALLDRIEKQELAEHRKQFKKYLNEEMITKMSDFQTSLERHEEEIEESIDALNGSMEKIDFRKNPLTFIRLHVQKDNSPRIQDFKERLNGWKPNLLEFERTKDDNILEESFNKIKSLLDLLTCDESYKKEVLDVRNWLKFTAKEHYREQQDLIFRMYGGTATLSGGEGSQLTYTILSAAIAYQFGIHREGMDTNSFRFICVDEAFSKQDDEKARFLMELCKQLHLQLMVVSPAKAEDVAVVEPFISRVHFVQRKNNQHSIVLDMPIKQLQQDRDRYLHKD